jgi:hypothetical protein
MVMQNGDKYLLSFFKNLQSAFKDYAHNISEISSLLDKAILRINVLIEPTIKNELKVYSVPPMRELSGKMSNCMNQLREKKEMIAKYFQNINEILEDGKVKCSDCNGEGKVKRLRYEREEGIITSFYEYEPCPTCGGSGYFAISEEVRRQGYEILKALKMIAK